jgi:hypothetical protein
VGRRFWRYTDWSRLLLPSGAASHKPRIVTDFRPANDFQAAWPFSLTSLSEILAAVSPGSWGAVRDFKGGYNHIRLSEACLAYARTHLPQLGPDGEPFMRLFEYRRQFFGDSSAVAMFSALSGFITYLCRRRGLPPGTFVFAYIDDMTVVGPTKEACALGVKLLEDICSELGVEIEHAKDQGPAQVFTVLGVVINTVDGTLALPPVKVARRAYELLVTLKCVGAGIPVPKRFLRELVAKLEHWCTVFPAGSAFLQRLWDTMNYGNHHLPKGVIADAQAGQRPYQIFLNTDVPLHDTAKPAMVAAVAELRWWAQHLQDNGLQPQRLLGSADSLLLRFAVHTTSDAAGDVGYGIPVGPVALWGSWAGHERGKSSSYKELRPVAQALSRLGPVLAGQTLVTLTDNQGNASILNRQRTKGDGYELLQAIATTCLRFELTEVALFAPREANVFCDALSRCTTAAAAVSLCRHPVVGYPDGGGAGAVPSAGGGLIFQPGESASHFGRRARTWLASQHGVGGGFILSSF